eukprot:scaffold10291_cov146-Isochrysis_galbana.AAC.2
MGAAPSASANRAAATTAVWRFAATAASAATRGHSPNSAPISSTRTCAANSTGNSAACSRAMDSLARPMKRALIALPSEAISTTPARGGSSTDAASRSRAIARSISTAPPTQPESSFGAAPAARPGPAACRAAIAASTSDPMIWAKHCSSGLTLATSIASHASRAAKTSREALAARKRAA